MNSNPDHNPTPPDNPENPGNNDFGHVIHSYTRKQALAEGFQVDVSETAREAGFRFPVFMTSAVFDTHVKVPQGVRGQDERGRLWDILWMLHVAIKQASAAQDRLSFQLHVRNDNRKARLITLLSVCGPLDIDDPSPSITIMMPGED